MTVKNLLVAQSGGPTAAINATLSGVLEAGLKSEKIGRVYGGFHGVEGLLKGEVADLTDQLKAPDALQRLSLTPGMALRSCRFKMPDPKKDDAPYAALIALFKKLNIGYFFYIGGNDSMDTALKLHHRCAAEGLDVKVIGVPKTIDNDLAETDHTPGFGSAAKYVCTSIIEVARDASVYPSQSVMVVEIMGRDAGWLTASSGLAQQVGAAPHLIYIPERAFDAEGFIADLKELMSRERHIIIAVSEGIRDKEGEYVHADLPGGERSVDSFGHVQLSGAGRYLEHLIKTRIGCKVRSIELSVLQRSAGHCLSKTDVEEAAEVGRRAVELALNGESGKMAAIRRLSNSPYSADVVAIPLEKTAAFVKPFPQDWLKEDNSGLSKEAIEYFLPLINGELRTPFKDGLPDHFVFDDTFMKL